MNREMFIKILSDYYATAPPIHYVVAVDFDGTLCNSNYPECGEEIAPICNFIRSISDLSCYIILTTCRHGKCLIAAKDWCKQHNIKIDFVNRNVPERIMLYGDCRKISCNMLIDDMAYNFNINDFE